MCKSVKEALQYLHFAVKIDKRVSMTYHFKGTIKHRIMFDKAKWPYSRIYTCAVKV